MPIHIDIPSPFSMRQMAIFQRSTSALYNHSKGNIWESRYTITTVPTAPVADGLAEVSRLWARVMAATDHAHFQWRKDVQFQTNTSQSTVYTRCSENLVDYTTDINNLQLRFSILSAAELSPGAGIDGTVYQEGYASHDNTTIVDSIEFLSNFPSLLECLRR